MDLREPARPEYRYAAKKGQGMRCRRHEDRDRRTGAAESNTRSAGSCGRRRGTRQRPQERENASTLGVRFAALPPMAGKKRRGRPDRGQPTCFRAIFLPLLGGRRRQRPGGGGRHDRKSGASPFFVIRHLKPWADGYTSPESPTDRFTEKDRASTFITPAAGRNRGPAGQKFRG